MRLHFFARFTRSYRRLPPPLREDFNEKIKLFCSNPRDPHLGTHKLKGRLKECFAFNLQSGYRVLFELVQSDLANLLDVGPHDKYRQWKE